MKASRLARWCEQFAIGMALRLIVAACLVAVFHQSARADSWRGQDKQEHALAGCGISWWTGLHTGDPVRGFAWAAGIGAAKEITDPWMHGERSFKDFAVTAAAGAVCAGGVQLVLKRGWIGVNVPLGGSQ